MIFNELGHGQTTNGAMAHWRIVAVAKGIAGKKYDMFANDDEFYKMFPNEQAYIDREYGRFIPEARTTLAKMLALPTVSEADKAEIMDALLLDKSLPVGRISGIAPVIRKLMHATRH